MIRLVVSMRHGCRRSGSCRSRLAEVSHIGLVQYFCEIASEWKRVVYETRHENLTQRHSWPSFSLLPISVGNRVSLKEAA